MLFKKSRLGVGVNFACCHKYTICVVFILRKTNYKKLNLKDLGPAAG